MPACVSFHALNFVHGYPGLSKRSSRSICPYWSLGPCVIHLHEKDGRRTRGRKEQVRWGGAERGVREKEQEH